MGERTSYPPGTFCWADLVTSDAQAAKAFYEDIFGWGFDDMPAGEGMTYTFVTLDGAPVGALSEYPGVPPRWNNYVSVADADAICARVTELGGEVREQPFDVFESGRMAAFADPTGAECAIWQPRDHIGASVVNQPGAMTWNDLTTPDVDAAARFYSELFGWQVDEIPDAGGYRTITLGGRLNGGMQPQRAEGMPPAWIPYFGHADVEQAIEKIGADGGKVWAGPIDMPNGRIAVASDPQGATFAIWTGAYDD